MRQAIALGILLGLFVCSMSSSEEAKPDSYKNVHYLLGLSKTEFSRTMNFMRGSLGVHCDFCHVVGEKGWVWESDEKPEKKKARQMIAMVLEINRTNFNNKPLVSCFTCHQGQIRPNGLPPLPQADPPHPTKRPDTGLVDTPAQQIVERYEQATGGAGRTSVTAATTIVMKGTTDETWKRKVVPFEAYFKAPGKWRITVHNEKGPTTYASDGVTDWVQEAMKSSVMTKRESAYFHQKIDELRLLPGASATDEIIVRRVKVNDHETYALEYDIENGKEHLYFDSQSSLLVRRMRFYQSPLGTVPQQIEYENYKQFQGLMIPYTLRSYYVDPWDGGSRNFDQIEVNVPVEDSLFQMPPSEP